MIVWVNGAFGAGKTQAAFELVRRLDRAVLCDPEVVGYGLQRFVPPEIRRDFQDEPAWRRGVLDGLTRTDISGRFDVVVVPMTVVDADRASELFGTLRARGHDLRHVVLDCDEATLRRRLRARIAGIRHADTWAMQQIPRCLAALPVIDQPVAGEHPAPEHVDSATLDHDQVVETIAARLGLSLVRPRRGRLARPLQTLANGVRVIRW